MTLHQLDHAAYSSFDATGDLPDPGPSPISTSSRRQGPMKLSAQELQIIGQQLAKIEDQITLQSSKESTHQRNIQDEESSEAIKFRSSLQLDRLMFSLKGLRNAKAELMALLSPVNKLPNEVLSYIFQLGAEKPPDWLENGVNEPGVSGFPLLVTHVCTRWRQIAISTPSLWTHLTFSESTHPIPSFQLDRLWLERSKACQVDVYIERHIRYQSIPIIFDILEPHFHRLRSFFFIATRYFLIEIALKRFPTFAPVLQSLHLVCKPSDANGDSHSDDLYSSPNPFLVDGAPLLRHARFRIAHLVWNTFPSANLETLNLSHHHLPTVRPSWQEFVDMLTASPRLHSLTLYLSGPHSEPGFSNWPNEPILLPLVTFHFSDEEGTMAEILDRLILPNIKELSLNFNNVRSTMIADVLCERQNRFEGVEKLEFVGSICPSSTITDQIIRDSFGFPNVTDLIIRDSFVVANVLSSGHLLCFPKLERLTSYHLTAAGIRTIAQVRKEIHRVPLRYVRIVRGLEAVDHDGDLAWLQANVPELKYRFLADLEEEFEQSEEDLSEMDLV